MPAPIQANVLAEGGASNCGAPKGGARKGGAPKGRGPNLEKVEAPKGGPLRGVAQVELQGVQVVEVGVQLRVHQDRGVEEDVEGQVEVEREEGEVKENHTCMKMGWNEDSRTS